MNLIHFEMLKHKGQTWDENQLLVLGMTKHFMLMIHVFPDQVISRLAQPSRMSPQLLFHYVGNENVLQKPR